MDLSTAPLLSLPSVSFTITDIVLFVIGLAIPVALYLGSQYRNVSWTQVALALGGILAIGGITLALSGGLPTITIPSLPDVTLADAMLALLAMLVPTALYLGWQYSGVSWNEVAIAVGALFVLGVLTLAVSAGLPSVTLPSLPSLPDLSQPVLVILLAMALAIPVILYALRPRPGDNETVTYGLPTILGGIVVVGLLAIGIASMLTPDSTLFIPDFTFKQTLMLIVACSIPMTVYLIGHLTRVIKWMDVAVSMGLMMVPTVVILGLGGFLSASAVTGALGILVAHALGIIVVD